MSKQEDIFLGTCIHIAKEDMVARGKPIEGNTKQLFEIAEEIYREAHKRGFLELPAILEKEDVKK